MPKRSLLTQTIMETSFILACLTSLIYLIGITYYNSLFSKWRLEASLFPLRFETVLTKGFEIVFPVAWRSISCIVTITMCILLFIICLQHLDKYRWYRNTKQKLLNIIVFNAPLNHATSLTREDQFMRQLLNRAATALITLFVVASLILLADKRGNDDYLNLLEGNKPLLTSEIITKAQPCFVKGYIIQCSDLMCAIYSEHQVVMINLVDIERIRRASGI
jgi:hypothetical protein